jgi:uncharacterized protein (DUF362 family)
MNKPSRRDFLARSATAAGALALGAERLLAGQGGGSGKPADLAIARWRQPKDLSPGQIRKAAVKLTEAAIEGLGGLKRFVSKGDVVWVKPNIGWDRTPELAACTNPDVVATLVRLCFEAGAKAVKLGDNPCDIARKTYESSGIAEAVRPLGAEVVFLDRRRFRDTAIKGERVKTLAMYPAILDCDLVINVPVVKHHGLAKATLCMKNYLGVMDNRRPFHQALPVCVADLTRYMKPRLCVLDAVRILTAHGPKGGNPADVQVKGAVAAGVDIVALDAWGAEIMGKKPTDIGTIVKGQEVGLGTMDYRSLKLKEIAVS